MNLQLCPVRGRRGITLVVALIIAACTLLILASTLSWTATNVTLSERNNEYFRTLAVAEAATEKILAAIESDYQANGDAGVQPNLATYRGYVPKATENAVFGKYDFSDANPSQPANGKTYLQFLPPTEFRVLNAQYEDLYGYSSIYRVISNAREKQGRHKITAAVWQDVETATIPLFQFAIFYTLDLEINPGVNMTVTGPVHSNSKLYLDPGAVLKFESHVTSSSEIIKQQKPGDPNTDRSGTLSFPPTQLPSSGVSTLNVPIGTDNSVTNVRQVVEPPPFGEDADSAMGKQRFHNKADLIVTVTDATNTVTSGIVNNKGTVFTNIFTLPPHQKWLNTSRTLYNKRENKTVKLVEIDVGKLVTWNTSVNNTLPVRAGTGGTKDVTIVYVDDQRTMSGSQQSGVMVRNGALLTPYGLTVATPEPIYVHGNYNVQKTASATPVLGSSNTSQTLPAALVGDAITVLSASWVTSNPDYGTSNFTQRAATDTTVNAAFLAGIVETKPGDGYSGGAENFPRFLEDWSPSSGDKTFTYNGSMVVMYPSKYAKGLWLNTGSTVGIYDPPVRKWAFDKNFRDPAKLPPGTPSVRVLIRGAWAAIRPNTVNITDPDALVP